MRSVMVVFYFNPAVLFSNFSFSFIRFMAAFFRSFFFSPFVLSYNKCFFYTSPIQETLVFKRFCWVLVKYFFTVFPQAETTNISYCNSELLLIEYKEFGLVFFFEE